jgi:carbon monoxide dehydrogenase subunit G
LWDWLRGADAALAAVPGATLTRDGGQATGSLRIKPGHGQITYRVTAGAALAGQDERGATVVVTGKEARGGGTIAATVSVTVADAGEGAELVGTADIEVTGRAADAEPDGWHRVLAGVGDALLAAYSAPVVEAETEPVPEPPAADDPTPALSPTPARTHQVPTATSRPLRGPAIAVGVLVLLWLLRRSRRSRG